MSLQLENVQISVNNKEIIKGMTLVINPGEIHALMGPNGSGKSTLAAGLMGHPKYSVSGKLVIDGEDLLPLAPDERAKRGLFLSFQYPLEIPGVTVENFMRLAYNSSGKNASVMDFHKLLLEKMDVLKIDHSFARRYLNDGFSGGEKKRMEILQMLVLNPRYIILDETDSGLDVDALRVVSEGINKLNDGTRGILLITHFNRMLKYVKPNFVHVLVDGRIVRSGDAMLAHEIDTKGYAQ